MLCSLCHKQIHRFYSELELAERLNTREALLAEPQVARFVSWARRQHYTSTDPSAGNKNG